MFPLNLLKIFKSMGHDDMYIFKDIHLNDIKNERK